MNRYRVGVLANVGAVTTVQVNAESESEAETMAAEMFRDRDALAGQLSLVINRPVLIASDITEDEE